VMVKPTPTPEFISRIQAVLARTRVPAPA